MKYITIDGGTTNTRVFLVSDNKVIDSVRFRYSSNHELKTNLRNAVGEILSKNDLEEFDIKQIIASGMITSEIGLCNIEHIYAPAGIEELHNSIKKIKFPEISNIDIAFIPGIKIKNESFADMMRGEETEFYGLCNESVSSKCAYLLPGSHSKCIIADKNNKIAEFYTYMTGEMFAALRTHTILKNTLTDNESFDFNSLLEGYRLCEEYGFNAALFQIRIMDKIYEYSNDKINSCFEGIILHDEIKKIISLPVDEIFIGGKKEVREHMYYLLEKVSSIPVTCLGDSICDMSVPCGAVKIYEYQ